MAAVQQSRDHFSWPQLLLPWEIVRRLVAHGTLLRQFTLRDILARYRGSYLGVVWSLLRPLGMLTVYVVVFGFILQPQLGGGTGKLDFVLSMFCGLILFDFFAEAVGRSPALVVSKPNFVTKVVFPLEILSLSAVAAALVQMIVSFVPFFCGVLLAHGTVPATATLLPLVVAPLICFALGFSWLLSSLGVFVRDLNAMVPLLLTVLMFASAIFYSLSSVPSEFRWLFDLNPIAALVDDARKVAVLGLAPEWGRLGAMFAAGVVVAVAGYAFFMRTKRGFADVV
ncbi:ABC transporter permease [Bradyrhizobium sp. SZCCHNRI20481]|uniref:ABC transporter permease n=1 Tax=Bradyrhizobium sp. SZCCHNRI20481 TaxID=3057286 RepID=UPI002916870E|nr:ABC transporter permease [Bradyrhizobium sp. SZCCHNRI20481]